MRYQFSTNEVTMYSPVRILYEIILMGGGGDWQWKIDSCPYYNFIWLHEMEHHHVGPISGVSCFSHTRSPEVGVQEWLINLIVSTIQTSIILLHFS